MPSSPLPPAVARAALAGFTPPRLALPLSTGRAQPGGRGLGAPPPPGPAGDWEGARSKGGSPLASLEWAAALGRGGSGSSSPSHPLPPLATCGGPGQEEAAHGRGLATTVS